MAKSVKILCNCLIEKEWDTLNWNKEKCVKYVENFLLCSISRSEVRLGVSTCTDWPCGEFRGRAQSRRCRCAPRPRWSARAGWGGWTAPRHSHSLWTQYVQGIIFYVVQQFNSQKLYIAYVCKFVVSIIPTINKYLTWLDGIC